MYVVYFNLAVSKFIIIHTLRSPGMGHHYIEMYLKIPIEINNIKSSMILYIFSFPKLLSNSIAQWVRVFTMNEILN